VKLVALPFVTGREEIMMAHPVDVRSQQLSWRLLTWREWLCLFMGAVLLGGVVWTYWL
jgi:hypothetical protein